MKHFKFTASEVIGFLRVMRPGSVVGPQQNWLHHKQRELHLESTESPLQTRSTNESDYMKEPSTNELVNIALASVPAQPRKLYDPNDPYTVVAGGTSQNRYNLRSLVSNSRRGNGKQQKWQEDVPKGLKNDGSRRATPSMKVQRPPLQVSHNEFTEAS
jgi:hypothetical protein